MGHGGKCYSKKQHGLCHRLGVLSWCNLELNGELLVQLV